MKTKVEKLLAILAFTAIVFNFWISSTLIAADGKSPSHGTIASFLLPPKFLDTVKHITTDTDTDTATATGTGTANSTRPYFILHIGPPKTATTFIQCGLQKLSKELAYDDSYYFVGKHCAWSHSTMENGEKSIPGHFLIMGLNDAKTQNRGYIALKSRMDYHRANGNNIIYSNEGLANHLMDHTPMWDCLQTMLEGWNVRIVIGYRHYFDWIRSFYYQTHKQNERLDKLWPTQGHGKPHESFLSYLDHHLERKETGKLSVDGGRSNQAFGHHLTITAFKKFSPHFHNIQILNLHDSEDMVTDFVCTILPNAEKTCHRLRASVDDSKGKQTRPLQSLDAHRIAEAAFAKGYITEASPKNVVVTSIQEKIKKTGVDSRSEFLACPEPSLSERLLSASIEFEEELSVLLRREKSTEEREKAKNIHTSMYRRNEATGRFCEINPELILKNGTWVNMLTKIGVDTAKK